MGYYIQTGNTFNRAQDIVREHGAKVVSKAEAREAMKDPSVAVVCVKTNALFDAAGFCFDDYEFDAFDRPSDSRPTTWLTMDRSLCEKLTGFNEKQSYAVYAPGSLPVTF